MMLCACQKSNLSITERAFLALPDDAFESIFSSLTDPALRDSLLQTGNTQTGRNEDTRFFSLDRDEDNPNELTVRAFQDPVFDYLQLGAFKMEGKDEWFILVDIGESIDEMPMVSLKTTGYVFHEKKGTLEACGLQSEPYQNDDFVDPVLSWPYLGYGVDVESVHHVLMPFGYYICPNPMDPDGEMEAMNPIPFSLKYVWDGEFFNRAGYGPSYGFVDNLAAFTVSEQMRVPEEYEFPGCRMEMTSEEGYNNVPVRHFDLYKDDEHLLCFDPFPGMSDEEGHFIIMQIRAFSPQYKTTEGLGVGSLMKDIDSSETLYGMDAKEFGRAQDHLEDGRAYIGVTFPGFESEMLFVTDGPEALAETARVVEVIIRPIAKG